MTIDNKNYSYLPQEDITVFELAKLHQLISVSMISPMRPADSDRYMERYNLIRHFTLETK
jgi:hypothetical protein